MSDGTIVIDTKIDSSGAEKGINGLNSKLNKLAKGSLKLLTKGVVAAGTALGGFGIASINLASDLTEVQNVVDVTFGDNAEKINAWAKNAATAFGMSELQAKQFNGTMGAMLKSMGLSSGEVLNMSKSLTGLAGDFASFYNLKPEEAFEKLRSGISGETEPLKQLGINMSVANLEAYALTQGITKQYKEMSQAEQATLRYNYLMSVSADAQGDFARTSDSLANQLRIAKLGVSDLSAAIGTELMPMAQEAVKGLNENVKGLKKAFEEGGFEGLATELGNVLTNMVVAISSKIPDLINVATNVVFAFINSMLKALPGILEVGVKTIGYLIEGIGMQLPTLIPTALECILSLIKALMDNLPLVLNAGMDLIYGLTTGIINAIPVLVANLPIVIQSILDFITSSLPNILNAGLDILLTLIDGIVACIPQLIAMLPQIINAIVDFILNNLPTIVDMGLKILVALIDGIIAAIPQLISMLPQVINAIISTLIANLPQIIRAGIEIIFALINGLIRAIPDIVGAIPQIVRAIWDAFTSVDWWDLGSNIIKGIGSGIAGAVRGLVGTAIEACKSLKDSVKNFFGIASPSKLMRDLVGVNLMRGIGVGVEMETPDLQDKIDNNLGELYSGLRMAVDAETAKTSAMVAGGRINNATNTITHNDNGITQNVTIVNPERTPSENARALKKAGRDLAFG